MKGFSFFMKIGMQNLYIENGNLLYVSVYIHRCLCVHRLGYPTASL